MNKAKIVGESCFQNKTKLSFKSIPENLFQGVVLSQVAVQLNLITEFTEQKMKFSIKDFFGKCDQIRSLCSEFCSKTYQNQTFVLTDICLTV